MIKRCLTFLLKEQGYFNPETCERLEFNISDNGYIGFHASATPVAGSQRSSTHCNAAIKTVAAVDGKTQEKIVEGHDDDEDLEEEEGALGVKKSGGQTGRKHICVIKRVALNLAKQHSLIEFYDAQVEKIS
jgi:hypothetical protein